MASRVEPNLLQRLLRIDAVLMTIIWVVPTIIFIIVLLTSADEILG